MGGGGGGRVVCKQNMSVCRGIRLRAEIRGQSKGFLEVVEKKNVNQGQSHDYFATLKGVPLVSQEVAT